MKIWLQLASGAILALLSGLLIFGSLLVSLTENGYSPASQLLSGTSAGLHFLNTQATESLERITLYPKPIGPAANSPPSTPTPACAPPPGWARYMVQSDDTFSSLAHKFETSVSAITDANCLNGVTTLLPGTLIYVPNISSTISFTRCGAPGGWPTYYVHPGETLYNISLQLGVSISQLQYANCMGDSTVILAGQGLRVPSLPLYSPTSTFTRFPSATLAISNTSSPAPSFITPLVPSSGSDLEITPSDGLNGATTNAPTQSRTGQPPVSTDTPTPTDILFFDITAIPLFSGTPQPLPIINLFPPIWECNGVFTTA